MKLKIQPTMKKNIYGHFKDSENYYKMSADPSQSGGLFATAKTHVFSSISDITLENHKLRLTMGFTRRYT